MATKGQFEICNCGTQYTVSHKWNHRRNEHLKWKHHDEIAKALWTVFGRHLKDGESCVISSYTEVKLDQMSTDVTLITKGRVPGTTGSFVNTMTGWYTVSLPAWCLQMKDKSLAFFLLQSQPLFRTIPC